MTLYVIFKCLLRVHLSVKKGGKRKNGTPLNSRIGGFVYFFLLIFHPLFCVHFLFGNQLVQRGNTVHLYVCVCVVDFINIPNMPLLSLSLSLLLFYSLFPLQFCSLAQIEILATIETYPL